MRKFIFNLIWLSTVSVSISQNLTPTSDNIIPVEEFKYYYDNELNGDLPKGTYFSDVNDVLTEYIGTWNYESSDLIYTVETSKVTSNYHGLMVDEIIIKYRVVEKETGEEIANTLALENDHPRIIKGEYLSDTGTYYVLSYIGENALCGEIGTVFIEVRNSNQLLLFLVPKSTLVNSSCPDDVSFNLPKERITLLKM